MVTPSWYQKMKRGVGPWRPALLFILLPIALGLLMLALLGAPVQAQEPSPTFALEQVTPPSVPPAASFGRSSYEQNCAPCHGLSGLGDGSAAASLPYSPTLFAAPEAIWGLTPAEMFHTTKYGRIERLMPPWQNQLSDEQIWQTLAYAWSLHTNADEVAAGQALYAQSCAGCHGDSGAGDGPDALSDLPNFGDLTYAMTHSQEDWLAGWLETHPEIGGDWTPDEQRQALEYVRSFSYIPAWESGYRPGAGVIRGMVVEGSAGVEMAPAITVMLEAYAQFTPVAAFSATVDADGGFEFTDLAVDPNLVYLVSTVVDNIRYTSPIVNLTDEASEAETTVTIYATTNEPEGIEINRTDWIIDDEPGALLVVQLYFLGSQSDRTYTGSPLEGADLPVTVGMYIPPDAEQITFEEGVVGGRFQQVGGLYYDTAPLIPGEGAKQIVVRYRLPYDGTAFTYSQQFLYPIRQMNLLVAELPQLEKILTPLSAAPLEATSSQEFQGRAYSIYQASDLPATEIEVALTGLLTTGAADPRDVEGAENATPTVTFAPWMAWAIGGLGMLILVSAVLWAWRSGHMQTGETSTDLRQDVNDLAQRIAKLDDRYTLSQLDAASWQRERSQLKARMLEVAQHLENAPTE